MHKASMEMTIRERKDAIKVMIDFMEHIHSVTSDQQKHPLDSIEGDKRKEVDDDVQKELDFLKEVGLLAVSK